MKIYYAIVPDESGNLKMLFEKLKGQKGGKMKKYPFLRFATIVFRIVGWIILVVGIIGSIVFGIRTGGVTGVSYAVGGAIFSFLAWLFLLATRELIYLLVNVEENTRITAENTGITAESIRKKSR